MVVSRFEESREEDKVLEDCVEMRECRLDPPTGSIPAFEGVRKGFKMLPIWLKVLMAALPAVCKGDRPGRCGCGCCCCCCCEEGEVCSGSEGKTIEEEPCDARWFSGDGVGEGVDRDAGL